MKYALLLVVLAAAPLSAQRVDTAVTVLPSIDVHASRSVVPASRLPFAVTSHLVSPLLSTSATSADAALRAVPGVQVSNRFNDAVGERITIRGMGARAQFGIRGIRVLVDGIPATMPDGQTTLTHLDAAAVTSSEVLRGPAGSLWGNASGGVIELRTAPFSDHLADGSFTTGANGLTRGTAVGAFTPTSHTELFGRVTAQDYEGFRNHATSRKTLASGGGNWLRGASRMWFAAHAVDYNDANPGSLSQAQLDSSRTQANPNNVRQKTGENGRHVEAGAGWQRDVGALGHAGTLEISAYALHRSLTNPIPPTIIDLARNAGGARAVVATSAASRVSVTAGVEGGLQSDDRANHVNTLGARGSLTLDQAERVLYAAPFAQGVLSIDSNIDALAALRYDHYTFRARDHLVTATDPDDSGERTMNAPSATFGARARVGRASIYSNYATSFQTPTTTELANRPDGAGGFNPDLSPERTHSIEAGASADIGMLHVDGAAYRAHVRNALIPFEVPDAPGRQYFRNAGSVNNRGAEIGASARIERTVDITAAYTHTSSVFDDYVAAGVVYNGNRVPGVAGDMVDGTVTWDFVRNASALLAVHHSSSLVANDANTATSAAFTLLDASADFQVLRARRAALRVNAGVTNIADVAYNATVSINAAGSRYYEPGPGRSVYVSVSVSGGRGGAR